MGSNICLKYAMKKPTGGNGNSVGFNTKDNAFIKGLVLKVCVCVCIRGGGFRSAKCTTDWHGIRLKF